MPLDDSSLKAFYKMEEATGASRLDSTANAHTLSDHSSVVQVVGKLGPGPFAAGFTAASSQYLSSAHSTDFSPLIGNEGFTIAGWVYPTTTGSSMTIASNGESGTPTVEWELLQRANNGLDFYLTRDGSISLGTVTASGTLTTNAWNFIAAWWDKAAATVNIRLNCNAAISVAASPNVPYNNGSSIFLVGRGVNNASPTYFTGRIDSLGIWQRVLTADELCTCFFNNDLGNDFPFTGTGCSGGGGGGDVPCVVAHSQLWTLTTGTKANRIQRAATRDMLVGTDLTTGAAKPNWRFSTGFDRPGKFSKVKQILVDATGRDVDVFPSKSMDDADERRISVPIGETLTEGAGDMASSKWRIRVEGEPESVVRVLMWDRDPLDRVR